MLHQYGERGIRIFIIVEDATRLGTDALAEVSVRLSENGRAVTGKGAEADTLVASAKAYLAALNNLMIRRRRGQPEALAVTP